MKHFLLSIALLVVPVLAESRRCPLCYGQGHKFGWWCLCCGGSYHTCIWCDGRGVIKTAYGDAKEAAR